MGHYIVGTSIGGTCSFGLGKEGFFTECYFPHELTYNELLKFYLAGIGAEVLFSLILLLIPYTSALGGAFLLNVGYCNLVGEYSSDLKAVGLENFLRLPFRILIFIVSILIFLLSLYVYHEAWVKAFKKV